MTADEIVAKWRLEREAREQAARDREAWRYKPGRRWLLWAPRAQLRGKRYRITGHVTLSGHLRLVGKSSKSAASLAALLTDGWLPANWKLR